MKKWIIVGALVLLITSGQLMAAEATNTNLDDTTISEAAAEQPMLEVLVPQKDRVTSRETMMISFRAPSESLVTVEVFHTAGVVENETEVALYEPMHFKIGVLERGWVELKLRKGINRIVLTTTMEQLNAEPKVEVTERIITVKDLEEVREELSRNVMQTTATDLIRRLTNME